MSKDELGKRMKEHYENRTQTHLPRRTYTFIRLDGKSFHTYLKGYNRPYDTRIMRVMDNTAIALCETIQGAKMAYVQSDEISILLTDFDTIQTDAWFDGNVQKITSVSASIATAHFNLGMYLDEELLTSMTKIAYFDSRVWSISDRNEVFNYFVWRQQDATRNSIQMGAQSFYSQKELHGKNTSELQEMMFQKGQNWNNYPEGFKRGRIILKEKSEKVSLKKGIYHNLTDKYTQEPIERKRWAAFDPPIFTQELDFLQTRTPILER